MVNVLIILGENDSKKSSTIRALTGVRDTKRNWGIDRNTGVQMFYVEPRSLQEQRTSPSKFINDVGNRTDILVALRIKGANRQPDAIDYIKAFSAVSWTISDLIVLDKMPMQSYLTSNFMQKALPISPHSILNTSQMTSNQIASQLRLRWNWL